MPSSTSSEFAVEIKSTPVTRVVALRGIVPNYNSQAPLWSRLFAFVATHKLPRTADACLTIFYDRGYKASDVDNEVCLPIASEAEVLEETNDIRVYELPALSRVASVIHRGPYSGLRDIYDQLFTWLEANGEACNGPNREIYHVGVDAIDGDEAKLVTEVMVPLATQ